MAYIYQADVWCDKCGEKIRAELTAQGKAPGDPEDERSYDSGDFPKYYDAENEESDSPDNCASGDCAGDRGTFLQNQLTSDGYKYLKSMLDEDEPNLPPAVQEWADYYSFKYHDNPYNSPVEWLLSVLEYHAKQIGETTHSSALLSIAQELARNMDSDKIQDLFQSDMEEDDYFKKSGWYSSEME